MTYTRKSFSGNAVRTSLTAGISSTATSIPVAATTGFPDTTTGDFVVTVDRGKTTEEKILISSYTTSALTVATNGRGVDGTAAQSHTQGATLQHTLDAATISAHETFVADCGTVTPAPSAVGDTAEKGTAGKPADASHRHARESWATGDTTTSKPGDTKSDGTSTSPARADHKHGRESVQCPIGAIVDWASTTLPPSTTGTWLFLHGQTISGGATTYATLAARYSSWVHTGNLELPDTRTKFVIGAGTKTAGTTGGAATVTLAADNLPKVTVTISDPGHDHTLTDPGHKHDFDATSGNRVMVTVTSSTENTAASGNQAISATSMTTAKTGITLASATTGITGSFGETTPTALSVEPPYIAFNKIVRAL